MNYQEIYQQEVLVRSPLIQQMAILDGIAPLINKIMQKLQWLMRNSAVVNGTSMKSTDPCDIKNGSNIRNFIPQKLDSKAKQLV